MVNKKQTSISTSTTPSDTVGNTPKFAAAQLIYGNVTNLTLGPVKFGWYSEIQNRGPFFSKLANRPLDSEWRGNCAGLFSHQKIFEVIKNEN